MLDVFAGIVVVGLFVAYTMRVDFAHYSIFTVGVYKRLYRYKAQNTDVECEESYCDRTVVEGETRKATKEIVVCGCPLVRYNTVTNHYCDSHGSLEYQRGEYRETTTKRLTTTLLTGLAECLESRQKQRDKPDFANATTAVSSAWSLIPVAVLVVIVAIVVMFGKSMAPNS
jgi:hypothetical protein